MTRLSVKNAEPERVDYNASATEILPYNAKSGSDNNCFGEDKPMVSVTTFTLDPEVSENASQMANIILRLLVDHDAVLVRGTQSRSEVSLYKTDGKDIQNIYKKLTTGGKISVIIEPFRDNLSTPDCQ